MINRIYCDVSRLSKRVARQEQLTGIDRVTTEYLDWSLRRGGSACVQSGDSLLILDHDESKDILDLTRRRWSGYYHPRPVGTRIRERLDKTWRWLKRRDLATLPKKCLVLNTAHSWLDNSRVWKRLEKNSSARVVTFIHDLIPLEFPEFSAHNESSKHHWRVSNALQYSSAILVNSHYTERSIWKYAGSMHCDELPLIGVAPLGVKMPDPVDVNLILSRKYFVMLGTIEPRKNHAMLLEVWRRLARKLGPATPELLIVGKRGWHCEHVLRMLEHCSELLPHVRHISNASDFQVANLVSSAQALLFPSFCEGFGLPMVEALSLGTPVICSDIDVFHEIAGDAPIYIDPLDGLGWLKQLVHASDPKGMWREAQLSRVQSFKGSTWKCHFNIVENLLDPLLKG